MSSANVSHSAGITVRSIGVSLKTAGLRIAMTYVYWSLTNGMMENR
jgi:hypothetical protein